MSATGQTTVDFGAFPGSAHAQQVVASAGVGAATLLEAWVRPVASADHTSDEHLVEPIRFVGGDIVAGVGFTIHAFAEGEGEGYRCWGLYNVNWAWV